jgi:hypothetical protein
MGTIASATKPRSDEAQGGPSFVYILSANNYFQSQKRLVDGIKGLTGKPAPHKLRTTVLLANAEAATER